MEKFKFYAPTKVYFGKDEEKRVGKILKKILPIVCVEVLLPIHYFQR